MNNIFPIPHCTYTLHVPSFIGLALHIRLGLLYVSESSGNIFQLRPATQQRRVINLTKQLRGGVPTVLSVDWLNGYLYLLEDPHRHSLRNIYPISGKNVSSDRRHRSRINSSFVELENFHSTRNDSEAEDAFIQSEEIPDVSSKWNIWRTDLMGEQLELVVGNLDYEPKHMQVDPYNGLADTDECYINSENTL